MKKTFVSIVIAAILLLPGCGLLTLHPIFTPADLVMHSGLIGTWKSADNQVSQFQPATAAGAELPAPLRQYASRFYLLTRHSSSGEVDGRFMAFLVKIGDFHFLDLYPLDSDPRHPDSDFVKAHKQQLHQICRLDIGTGQVKWLDFRDNYVTDLIKNKQVRIRHTYIYDPVEGEKDEVLITASTKELQSFLLKYGGRKEAYETDENKINYHKISQP